MKSMSNGCMCKQNKPKAHARMNIECRVESEEEKKKKLITESILCPF